jgi:hypothetical protein
VYGEEAVQFARRIVALQDLLGTHHDMSVGRDHLAKYAEQLSRLPAPRPAVYLQLGQLMAWHSSRMRRAHEGFLTAWQEFDRKANREVLLARLRRARGGK